MKNTKKAGLFLASTLIAAAALAGCGGGGGSPAPVPTTQSGSISGSAVKGLIKNAVVELAQFNSSNQPVVIGTGVTLADGTFSVSYSGYSGGPVQLTVRARKSTDPTGPATTVVCDVTDGGGCGNKPDGTPYAVGDEIPAPLDFQIRNCLPGPPTNGVRAPVTPFTEILVRRADERRRTIAAESDLRTALLNAASEVSQLIGGVDVLRLEAIDLSNPSAVRNATPDQLTYSALAAAVLAQVVTGGSTDGTAALDNAITTLVNRAGDGRITTDNLRTLINEAQSQLLGVGRQDDSGILATLTDNANQADQANGGSGGTYDPAPASGAASDAVARAKNLVQTVRNTARSQSDLENPANSFESQAQAGRLATDSAVQSLFVSLGLAVNSAAAYFDSLQGGTGTTTLTTQDSTNSQQTATITVSSPSGNDRTVSVVGNVRNEAINFSATFPFDPKNSTATQLLASFNQNSSIQTNGSGAGARLTIATGTATVSKSDSNPIKQNLDNIASASFSLDATLSQINVTSPLSFRGQISGSAVKCTKSSCTTRTSNGFNATFVPDHFGLAGTFSNSGNSLQASVTADQTDAANFDPDMNVGPGNVPQATVTVTGDATLSGAPNARLVISSTLTDVAPSGGPNCTGCFGPIGTVTVTATRGGNQVFRLQITSTASSDNRIQVVSTVTDSTGAVLTITSFSGGAPASSGGTEIGKLTVDSTEVGVVRKLSTGLIVVKYTDGTFESLFN